MTLLGLFHILLRPLAVMVVYANGSYPVRAFLICDQGFFNICTAVEGADANKAFAATSKTGTGGTHHACLLQQSIKKAPGVVIAFDPDIGCIPAADAVVTQFGHAIDDEPGVFKIAIHQSPGLGLAVIGVNRCGSLLDRVGDAVELGGVPPFPEVVEHSACCRRNQTRAPLWAPR